MDNGTSFIVYAPHVPCVALFVADMSSVAVQTHGYIWPLEHSCGFDIHSTAVTVDNGTSFIVYALHRPCVALFVVDMSSAAVQTRGHGSCGYIWP